jgi:hypothetical protein
VEEMNQEQFKSTLRTIMGTFGGVIIGWFASKGWHLTPDEARNFVALLQSPEIIGLILSAGSGIMGLMVHTQANAVAVVTKIAADPASPVVGVVTTDTPEGRAMASNPSAEIAVASTPGANAISRDNVPPMTPKTT